MEGESGYFRCPSCGYFGFDGTECFDCGYRAPASLRDSPIELVGIALILLAILALAWIG